MTNSAPGWTGKSSPSLTVDSSKPFGTDGPNSGRSLFFLDNDILVTLGAAGLLADAVKAFGFTLQGCRRLDTVAHMLRRGAFDVAAPDARQRAIAVCAEVPPIQQNFEDTLLLDRLTLFADPGEAALIARTLQDPHLLASGDKNWMRKLCGNPQFADLKAALSGKVVCLETMLDESFQRLGHRVLIESFSFVREHTVLRIVKASSDGVNLRDTLDHYLGDLERYVGPDFLRRP